MVPLPLPNSLPDNTDTDALPYGPAPVPADSEVVDLSGYMNAPTVRVEKPDFNAPEVDQTNDADFEPEDESDEPEEDKTASDYKQDAKLIVNLFDSLQTGFLTPA